MNALYRWEFLPTTINIKYKTVAKLATVSTPPGVTAPMVRGPETSTPKGKVSVEDGRHCEMGPLLWKGETLNCYLT